MGCCVSKCSPDHKPSPEEDQDEDHFNFNQFQDKLPISSSKTQTPPSLYSSTTKISPSPPSPTSSTSSISSFTCTTNSNTISSASSLSTASSSFLSSKDRSFSNDFLWSCYKDNPHIITRINSPSFVPPTKPKPQHNRKVININPSPPPPHSFSMPQKRVRSNSPTNLTRQKSFRKDTAQKSNMQSVRSTLRSPSPTRTFNGDNKCGTAHNLATTVVDSKRVMMNTTSKVSGVSAVQYSHHSVLSSTRKAANPNNCSRRLLHSGFRNSPKVDETVVKDAMSDHHDMDLTLMEDIDNPLIALDCFIFL